MKKIKASNGETVWGNLYKRGKGTAQTFGCGQAALEQGPLLNEAIPAAGDTLILLKTQKILQGRLVAIFCGLLGALLIANLVVNSGSKVFAIHLQIKARVPVELLFQVHLLRFPEKLAPILIALKRLDLYDLLRRPLHGNLL